MQAVLVAFTILAAVLNTIQTGANTTLNKGLGAPLWAAVIVGAGTLITTLIVAVAAMLVTGQRFPREALVNVPWWAWTGGILGATYVLATVLAADKVGAAVFIGLTVTIAIIGSIVLDHFGWLGFTVHKAGTARIIGGLLMVGGLGLIAKF